MGGVYKHKLNMLSTRNNAYVRNCDMCLNSLERWTHLILVTKTQNQADRLPVYACWIEQTRMWSITFNLVSESRETSSRVHLILVTESLKSKMTQLKAHAFRTCNLTLRAASICQPQRTTAAAPVQSCKRCDKYHWVSSKPLQSSWLRIVSL